jgi:hypothetical protein
MNTLNALVFTDSTAEYTGLQNGVIDFTDSPCSPSVCAALNVSSSFLVTAPIPEAGYYEIQFMLANNFWGCNFLFGNSACGVQIRQGIAHMMDKISFTKNELSIAGISTPLDNPVPTSSGGGLLAPNPCAYDSSFPQSGSSCVVGAHGGTAYHLGPATGADGYAWLYAPGSTDLNAAAYHLVAALNNIGQSTVGCDGGIGPSSCLNSTDSRITGVNTGATGFTAPTFYIRNDDPARRDLGNSLASQICYVFTGSYTAPCTPYIVEVFGDINAFPGQTTCTASTCLNWWMYTAAYVNVPFFDDSLYFTYNSRFVSASCPSPGTSSCPTQQLGGGFCSNQSLATASAADYMYLCSPSYDSLSSQMENSPCLNAPGDPASGQPNNGPGADCPNTSQLSAISAGIQAEAVFGSNVFTLPVFERTVQFGYLNNGWIRAINDAQVGLPNYFTWLDAYNPSPPVAGTIRLGLAETTKSVNPFLASGPQDLLIVGSVYDSLREPNPLSTSQQINWMTMQTQQLSNSSLSYTPPAHTLTTYRFTLRPDLFFQDGRAVTAYDVAFSYLSMVASGAYLGIGATSITGITIIGPREFDIGVSSIGPFVLDKLTTIPIIPGRYWTGAGSGAWASAALTCSGVGCPMSQYTLSGSTVNCAMSCSPFSAALMTPNPIDLTPTFNPIVNHMFVGSGPWECGSVTGSGSGTCVSGCPPQCQPGPGGGYALTRFGAGLAPASSTSNIYFRSSGDLALYLWSEENDISPALPLSALMLCYGQPVNLIGSCAHWQQGFGASSTGLVGVDQVSVELLRYGLNWVSPFEWATSPPLGIAPFPPVLYEGLVTLYPSTVIGCPAGYDC